MYPAGETEAGAGYLKLNRPRIRACMKRSETEAARPLPSARAAGPDRMELKGRHATDAPAPSERPRGRNRSRAGESVRELMRWRQPASWDCAGAGDAGAQGGTIGAAPLRAIDRRGEEVAAPRTLPLHHAGHRLPWLGVAPAQEPGRVAGWPQEFSHRKALSPANRYVVP